MKKIYQLKTILDIVIGVSIVMMAASLFGLMVSLIMGNTSKMNVTIGDEKIDHFTAGLAVVAVLMAIGYSLFIYAIFKLKRLVTIFMRKEFFTDLTVETLRIIGISMLASSVLTLLPAYIYGFANQATIHVKLNTISPQSMAFSIIISLFFIILSYIFNEAKIIKEENELVI